MSKSTEQPPKEQPKFPMILKAKTSEELSEQVNNLTAPEGANISVGCIARQDDGMYIVKVDIVKI
jgi:hypothetical protein